MIKTCIHLFHNIYILLAFDFLMPKEDTLRGEERKIVSARLYRSEFANFMKICNAEDKSVNQKLREIVREEIRRNFGDVLEGNKGEEGEDE